MLKASASIDFSFLGIILPQFRHFQPSKFIKWSKNDCNTINPEHFLHFMLPPLLLFLLLLPYLRVIWLVNSLILGSVPNPLYTTDDPNTIVKSMQPLRHVVLIFLLLSLPVLMKQLVCWSVAHPKAPI